MYTTILFDLDGTITNSEEGIIRSVEYALQKSGIKEFERSSLLRFIGPPLRQSFQEYFDMTPEQAAQATAFYRERYAPIGKFECTLYPGIAGLLQKLHQSGRKVVLATSKPENFAREILDHFSLTGYFTLIGGALLDGSRDTKESVLRYILDTGIVTGDAVMIGDTRFDMEGAAAVGLPAIGVAYGFGSRKELTEGGAVAIADDVAQLAALLDA